MSATDPTALDDTIMHNRIKQIVEECSIKVIVETGIYHGLSTIMLADMVPLVYAVDNNPNNIAISFTNIFNAGKANIAMCWGNSPNVLTTLMPHLPDETLFILDAHWEAYWPLLDEIDAIHREDGIIVVHDMQVPEHPELGYDAYGGQVLCYDYLKNTLTNWSPSHRIEYNEKSEGTLLPRGVAYIFPR